MSYQQHNLISLFRSFYQLNISSDLSTSCIALFMAILYRANELGFPDNVRITNSELSSHTGLVLQSIDNCRKTLCQYQYEGRENNNWLIRYKTGTTHRCGTYYINYDLLDFNQTVGLNLDKSQGKVKTNDSKPLQQPITDKPTETLNKTLHEDYSNCFIKPNNIHILDHNIEENIISLSQEDITKLESDNIDNSQKESERANFAKGKKLIEEQYPNYFINNMGGILSLEQRSHIITIGSFPEDKVRPILTDKAGKAKQPINMVIWTVEELCKNSNNGNGHKKVVCVQVSANDILYFDKPEDFIKYELDPSKELQVRPDLYYLFEESKQITNERKTK